MFTRKIILIGAFVCGLFASEKEDKRITIVRANAVSSQNDSIQSRLLEECIEMVPTLSGLSPSVEKAPIYLKEVNGHKEENGFWDTYSAVLNLSYKVKQKELLVVPGSKIIDGEPQLKVLEKSLMKNKKFSSRSGNGDIFAGRSKRKYYFSTEDGAVYDVMLQAENWLKSQNAVLCNKR